MPSDWSRMEGAGRISASSVNADEPEAGIAWSSSGVAKEPSGSSIALASAPVYWRVICVGGG